MSTAMAQPKRTFGHLPEGWEDKRKEIIQALQAPQPDTIPVISKRLQVSVNTIYSIRKQLAKQAAKQSGEGEDRGQEWGRLLSADIPLKMRSKALRDLIRSSNPVAVGRALELVLESDGLRKKASEPSKQTSIIVASSDDVGME